MSVFEEKNVTKAIIRVSVPAMLGQVATLIYNMADIYFVSLTKAPAQIAAVTLCSPVMLIIMSIAGVFGTGGSSVIARLIGQGEREESKRVLNFCNYATLGIGILVMVLGILFNSNIAGVIGADAENMEYTCQYLSYIFYGTPFVMLANSYTHLFRSTGLIKQATTSLFIGNGTNIVLDFLFIVVFKMGTAGAALATSLGFFVSTIYCLACMIAQKNDGNDLISLSLSDFRPTWDMVKSVVVIGVPGALITALLSISNIIQNNYISLYTSDAVAAFGISHKVNLVPILLSVGMSQGVAPLVGYHYGAKNIGQMKKTANRAIVYEVLLGAVFTVLYLMGSTVLAGLFMHEEGLIALTSGMIRIMCISGPLVGIINMIGAYFQALGKAKASLTITILRNVVLFIPALYILNTLFGLNGVVATHAVVEFLIAILSFVMYRIDTKRLETA
ncbi:MAG: MATE family efflux transporter [Erysipelotrichaceae bacterium]|nr:MATE family efflux transporter [Erysipelotrichaceae bacterium]